MFCSKIAGEKCPKHMLYDTCWSFRRDNYCCCCCYTPRKQFKFYLQGRNSLSQMMFRVSTFLPKCTGASSEKGTVEAAEIQGCWAQTCLSDLAGL